MGKTYGSRNYLIHPSALMMILIFCGIAVLFMAISAAYLYTRIDAAMHSVRTPWLFLINTLVLLSGSYSINRCLQYFKQKEERNSLIWGWYTILITLLFLLLQGVAWFQLLSQHITPGTSGGHGYLYAISILHFLHVIAGIPFLLRILLPLQQSVRQGHAAVFMIDPSWYRQLRHTAWYWHFIDVVWIYLMLFFLLNSFV